MLILALIASLAGAMVWQQWRAVQVEAAERARAQSAWILVGALDWARLILREDKQGIDHLGEPWAVPLAEARLSSFLAAAKEGSSPVIDGEDGIEAFLSGSITDAQSRFNLNNLVLNGQVLPAEVLTLRRLLDNVGVAPGVANLITVGLRDAPLVNAPENAASATPPNPNGAETSGGGGNPSRGPGNEAADAAAALAALNLAPPAQDPPVTPKTVEQLRWLGVDEDSLTRMAPYVTLLPRRTPLNLNTAPRELIAAVIDKLDLAGAQRLVQARERKPFDSLAEAQAALGSGFAPLDATRVGIASDYFEVRGRLRLGDRVLEERSLVWRNQRDVQVLSRERVSSQDKAP